MNEIQERTDYEVQLEMAAQSKGVPEHSTGGLVRWAVYGIRPGSFLTSVLSNDLFDAMGQADECNRDCLFNIVQFVFCDMPGGCWGSKEKVSVWKGIYDSGEEAR